MDHFKYMKYKYKYLKTKTSNDKLQFGKGFNKYRVIFINDAIFREYENNNNIKKDDKTIFENGFIKITFVPSFYIRIVM